MPLSVAAVTTGCVEVVASESACAVEMHIVGKILDEQSSDGLGHPDAANTARFTEGEPSRIGAHAVTECRDIPGSGCIGRGGEESGDEELHDDCCLLAVD